jgi:hypothetical protein
MSTAILSSFALCNDRCGHWSNSDEGGAPTCGAIAPLTACRAGMVVRATDGHVEQYANYIPAAFLPII